jgi:tetratricopeptide (TPR) repeat protein
MEKMPKQKADTTHHRTDSIMPASFVVSYYAVLGFLALALLFPDARLWSGTSLAQLPFLFQIVWLLLAALVPLPLNWWLKNQPDNPAEPVTAIRTETILLGALLVIAICMVLFKGETHLLGDGRQMIANLAKANPNYRAREIGAEYLALGLKSLVGDGTTASAQLVYQLISWITGILFMLSALFFVIKSGRELTARLFYFLILCSGGYMLLFFGYVENYPIFALSVLWFCLAGILIAEDKLNRWIILIPTALALLAHVLAVTLIPAAVYLLFRPTAIGQKLSGFSLRLKSLLGLIAALIAVIALMLWAGHDLYVRLAIIPILADRFTLAGYTLFSPAHLLDYANLLLILLPGIPVAVFVIFRPVRKSLSRTPAAIFLAIVTLCSLAALFLLDPKLGMARDWDLFAFAGIPILLLSLVCIVNETNSRRYTVAAMTLILAANLVYLIPRIIVQHSPAMGASYAERCMLLDRQKNRTSLATLQTYYVETNDTAGIQRIQSIRNSSFPQENLVARAQSLTLANKLPEARTALDSAYAVDPTYSEYWTGLAVYYLHTRTYDSALAALTYSDGLNPNNPYALQYMAYAQIGLGKTADAKQLLQRTIAIDSTSPVPLWRLARIYSDEGNRQAYLTLVTKASSLPMAAPPLIRETVTELVKERDLDAAVMVLITYVRNGGDTLVAEDLVNKFPELQPHIPAQPR